MTAPNLLTVEQFGDVVWKQLTDAFNGCFNMQFAKGIDTPNLSQCTDLTGCLWIAQGSTHLLSTGM